MSTLLAIGTVVLALVLKLISDWKEKRSLKSELPGYAAVTVVSIVAIIWGHNQWVFSLLVILASVKSNEIFRLFSKTSK